MNRFAVRMAGLILACGCLEAGRPSVGAAETTLEAVWADAAKTFGLGAGAAPQYEGADEYRPIPFVVARIRWGSRYFVGSEGSGFRADVVGSRFIEAGPVVSYRYARDEDVDDRVIARLPPVDASVEVGGFLALNFPFPLGGNEKDALTLAGNCLADVTGGHEGYTVRCWLLYRGLVSRRLVLQTGPFATYGSDRFMSAYYDISPAGSQASGLERFDARSGFKDVGARLNVRYKFTSHWNLNLTLSHRWFLGDARRSPVISERGSDSAWFGGAAVGYSF